MLNHAITKPCYATPLPAQYYALRYFTMPSPRNDKPYPNKAPLNYAIALPKYAMPLLHVTVEYYAYATLCQNTLHYAITSQY